ncbi:MAG: carbonic anhydrase family protein [Azoarcus sp.]|jgi:carbonic anhydrase|nr:carbonic anhydrase family protein [Azoarcus sp.]
MFLFPRIVFLLAAMAAPTSTSAQAADWEKIVGDNGRMVEIDANGIFSSDHGTKVSWGRAILSNTEAAKAGYRTIKALNRYDCLNRSFSTIKRVYLDDDNNVIREENVMDQTPMLVRRNSVDERILRKACGLAGSNAPTAKNNKESTTNTAKTTNTPNKANATSVADKLSKVLAAADRAAKSTSTASATAAGIPPNTPKTPLESTPLNTPPLSIAAATVNAAPEKSAVAEAPTKPVLTAPAHARLEPTPAAAPMPRQFVPASAPATPKIMPASKVPATQSAAGFHPRNARSRGANVVFPPPRPVPSATPDRARMRPAASSAGWSYYGAGSPESWGQLRPEWKLCGEGLRQSPIDFSASAPVAVDLESVRFDYRPSRFRITNTERQLRVRVDAGMSMEVRGQRYMLEGFVLHRPGEARIAGKAADMEVQFFHRDGEGHIAVLAVQAARGDTPNTLLQALLNNLPLEKGGSYMPETLIDLAAFLPTNPAHFLYMGSLTTPPCTEGVLWVVMKAPVTLSDEQFDIFSRLHPGNARPPQPANARLVLESR